MKINFPVNCTNEASKMAYCRRLIFLLTKLQSIMWQWHRDGITQTKYNKFPPKIKNRFPYTAKITEAQCKDFWENVYKPWEKTIHYELNLNQGLADKSEFWGSPDFGTVIDSDAT